MLFKNKEEYLRDKLNSQLSVASADMEFTILYNGKFLTRSIVTEEDAGTRTSQNKVYVRKSMTKDKMLLEEGITETIYFYVKTVNMTKANYINTMIGELVTKLESPKFESYTFDKAMSLEYASIIVDNSLKIIIIESEAYRLAKNAYEKFPTITSGIVLGNLVLSYSEVRTIAYMFRDYSLTAYSSVVFGNRQSKIVSKLYKSNRFFDVLKVYIPIFIDYAHITNPLLNDAYFYTDRNPLYQKFKDNPERRVVITVGDKELISCIMVTHLELCKALKLKKFMRFTPSFIYKLMVGLLDDTIPGFPNTKQTTYMIQGKMDTPPRFGTKLDVNQYSSIGISAHNVLNSTTSSEEQIEVANTVLMELARYQEVNNLMYHLRMDYDKLVSISTNYIDDRSNVSIRSIYEIISKAEMRLL